MPAASKRRRRRDRAESLPAGDRPDLSADEVEADMLETVRRRHDVGQDPVAVSFPRSSRRCPSFARLEHRRRRGCRHLQRFYQPDSTGGDGGGAAAQSFPIRRTLASAALALRFSRRTSAVRCRPRARAHRGRRGEIHPRRGPHVQLVSVLLRTVRGTSRPFLRSMQHWMGEAQLHELSRIFRGAMNLRRWPGSRGLDGRTTSGYCKAGGSSRPGLEHSQSNPGKARGR